MKILITGIAGSGKTTIATELNRLGYSATDLDTNGTCAWVNKKSGLETEYSEASGPQWIDEHRWQVIVPKLTALLSRFPTDRKLFVTGKIARMQVKEMSTLFDIIFLLRPDDLIIDERLAQRTSNHKNFAKTTQEREVILRNRHEFEKACLDSGALVISNNGSLQSVIGEILGKIKG